MGAQSDFIAETFMPSDSYITKRLDMARELIAAGMDLEKAATMLSIPVEQLNP